MDLLTLREHCLTKPATTEETPFGPDTLVFKVAGKMFAATNMTEESPRVNLKCDPDYATELRDRHEDIIPGWHMNKRHWNTVYLERDLSDKLIIELVDHSYDLVVSKMPRKLRTEFGL